MKMISFTDRELRRAWRQAWVAYETPNIKTNAHRLLLFYAVETGLKAVFLKKNSKLVSNGEFSNILHNLNRLMDVLGIGSEFHLLENINLDVDELGQPTGQRNAHCKDLNQIWRYGAQAKRPTDEELEAKLLAIQELIEGELR